MRAPSIAIAHLRYAARRLDERARNASIGRLMAWHGLVPMIGTEQRVAWERETRENGYRNRRQRRHDQEHAR